MELLRRNMNSVSNLGSLQRGEDIRSKTWGITDNSADRGRCKGICAKKGLGA